jgi:hypothetical protein
MQHDVDLELSARGYERVQRPRSVPDPAHRQVLRSGRHTPHRIASLAVRDGCPVDVAQRYDSAGDRLTIVRVANDADDRGLRRRRYEEQRHRADEPELHVGPGL